MKRTNLLMVMLLMLFTSSWAQTTVQGIPRQFPDSRQNVAEQALQSGSQYVDFDSIQFWAGSGNDRAALVIKWPKADGTSVCLVWGYKFDGETTGLEMIEAVTQADPSLKLLTQYTGYYGNTICGIGYGDVTGLSFNLVGAKADSRIMFGYDEPNETMGQESAPGNLASSLAVMSINSGLQTNGGVINHPFNQRVYGYPAYDYDYWQLPSNASTSTLWLSGWYNGYWSYWGKNSGSGTFSYSGVGASSREIYDGYVDGWSYNGDMNNWTGASMTGDYVYVPSGGDALGQGSNSISPRPQAKAKPVSRGVDNDVFSSKHFIIHNMGEYYAAFEEIKELGDSEEGVTIEFDESLKGQTLTAPYEDWKPYNKALNSGNVPIKIIGNGVTIDGVDKKFYIQGLKHLYIENLTLEHINKLTTGYLDIEVIVKNCRFKGCESILPQAFTFDPYSPLLRFENCMFIESEVSNGSTAVFGDIQYMSSTAKVEFVSCTFANNDASSCKIPGFNIFCMGDCKFVNCVFDNNKYGKGRADIASSLNPYLGEYNVINGTVSGITPSETNFVGECDPVVKVEDGIAYPLASGKAYANFPAGTVIEGVTMPETDYFGTPIDYTLTIHSGAVQKVYQEGGESGDVDYTKGTFIINEDWYGHQNSTVNFLTEDGEWIYRVVQKENPGVELGCTNQYGTIYGGRFYLIAKQDQDPGAKTQGARITICDAKTMKVLKQIPVIYSNENGKSDADGRGFLGVDEHKGYVGTSNGIFILDLDAMEITGSVSGTGNGTDDPYQALYGAQIGNMVRVNDRVFAVHQQLGVIVINPYTDQVETVIETPGKDDDGNEWCYGTIVLSKDGNLWLSVAATNGSGQADNKIVKINPGSLETVTIDLPEGIYGPGNSWYAWTPDCFCASTQNNVLYWNGGPNSWFSNKMIFKYDIDKNEVTKYLDFNADPDNWQIYGCSFRIDPVTDEAYTSLYKSFGDPTYVLRKYDNEGNLIAEYPMITNYWFPSIPVWPDNSDPELDIRNGLLVDEYVINLRERLTDDDNMAAAAVFTITGNTAPDIVEAEIVDGVLYLRAIDNGLSGVTVQANSNGKVVSTYFIVKVEHSGVDTINVEEVKGTDIYRIDGTQTSRTTRGINIIRQSDGKISKVYVK